jgi:hypothetical protein
MANKPTWFVNAVKDSDKDEKGRWTRMGVGFNNPKSKTITLYCDIWPYKVVLTPYEEPPKRAAAPESMDVFGGG